MCSHAVHKVKRLTSRNLLNRRMKKDEKFKSKNDLRSPGVVRILSTYDG